MEHSQLNIGVLLLPDFNCMASQAFIDPFRAANYVHGERLYRWDYLALDDHRVLASNGLGVNADLIISENSTRYDLIAICASFAPERYQQSELKSWLRRQARAHSLVAGIDTGAFVMAFAGLLDRYSATVHYEHVEAFSEMFPRVDARRELYIIDRQRLSCAGGVAALDLGLEIIQRHQGLGLANASARYLLHDRLRAGTEDQINLNHEPVGYVIPPRMRDVISLMEQNLEEPLSIPELARHTNQSHRQLERLFRRYTGASPLTYYSGIRLDRARSLLTQTAMTLPEIASACGFNSVDHMSRAYKRRFNITPSRDRTEGRIPFQFRSLPRYAGI